MYVNLPRRRAVLGLGAALTAGGVAASARAAAPPAPALTYLYEAVVQLAPDVPHGHTPHGDRIRAPILGGRFEGERLSGRIVPGGADWQLLRNDGWYELDARYFMETDDGVALQIRNRGLWHSPTGDWPADYAVTIPEFEAPDGRYGWLNHAVFVGTVGPAPAAQSAVTIRVWKVG